MCGVQELYKHEVEIELLQSREAGDSDHEVRSREVGFGQLVS